MQFITTCLGSFDFGRSEIVQGTGGVSNISQLSNENHQVKDHAGLGYLTKVFVAKGYMKDLRFELLRSMI